MNERNIELIKTKLLIKLYHYFDYDKKFDDLKTNANTEILFHFEYCSIKFNDFSRAFKF